MKILNNNLKISMLTLKLIALAAMLIDHAGKLIVAPQGLTDLATVMSLIGRISFPLFAFLISEGCIHTRSIPKYILRLSVLALISEPFFVAAFRTSPFGLDGLLENTFTYMASPSVTNVLATLALGAAACGMHRWFREKGWASQASVPAVVFMIIAQIMGTDYAAFGVGLIFLLYLSESLFMRASVIVVWSATHYVFNTMLTYGGDGLSDPIIWARVAAAALAVIPVCLYSGELGFGGRAQGWRKWIFYIIYPAHLALFTTLYFIMLPAATP